jgi:hypothetical protein
VQRWWLALALSLPGAAAAEGDCTNLEQASFLLGAWQSDTQGTRFIERWRRDEAGVYHGVAEAERDGERIQQEVMILDVVDGRLVYAADPELDGIFVEFAGVRCAPGEAVFENPEHDFPQRLRYQLDDSGVLTASVTDLEDQGFELEFKPDD